MESMSLAYNLMHIDLVDNKSFNQQAQYSNYEYIQEKTKIKINKDLSIEYWHFGVVIYKYGKT